MSPRPRYLRDLVVQYIPSRHSATAIYDGPISTAERAASIFLPRLQHEPQEVLAALYLDAKHQVLGYREVHRGTLNGVEVAPRDVFMPALLASAHGIIIAHNHPSGDPTPSPDDLLLTARLRAAADLLDIELYDHLIIGDGRYLSFKETGRL